MTSYSSLAINKLDDFIYGVSPRPVTLKNGLSIGGGTIYPELNFTLPSMEINPNTMDEVRAQYTKMITDACKRARDGQAGAARLQRAHPGGVFRLIEPNMLYLSISAGEVLGEFSPRDA
jgi:hypothetical protein